MSNVRRLFVATVLALGTATAASAARPIQLKFPRFEVPPHSDREVCTFIRLPMRHAFDATGSLIVNIGGKGSFTSHHFLLYAYTGADLAGFPADGQIVDSKACLDFGPADRNSRLLIATSQVPKKLDRLPIGVAQRLTPTNTEAGGRGVVGLILNSHWINGSDRTQRASVKVRIMSAKGKTVRAYLKPIFEVVANGFIDVGPGEVKSVGWRWGPGLPDLGSTFIGGGTAAPNGPACVVSLTSHTHKRGKLFTIDFVDAAGTRSELLRTEVYSDPQQLDFNGLPGRPAPLLIVPGERLDYTCIHDNGQTTEQRLGCEEEPGKAPGRSALRDLGALDGAAKRCSHQGPAPDECPATDPAYPNRQFTGNCVPARLVFGFTSDDDMCIMPGAYFDANPTAPPGHECDVSLLPPLP